MRRVSAPDLVGFPTQGQGHNDQVAGGALNQGRACAGPVLADDQVAFPVARDFPIRNVRALQSISRIPTIGGLRPLAGGFLRINLREGKQIRLFRNWVAPPASRTGSPRAGRVGVARGKSATNHRTAAPV